MSEEIANFGKFKVSPSFGGIKYYNTEITVYYHPANGQIVAAYYSMDVDYKMVLNMDINVKLPYIKASGPVSITNTTQSIKEFYFIKNNPNHIPW